jgi:hypothetical protein
MLVLLASRYKGLKGGIPFNGEARSAASSRSFKPFKLFSFQGNCWPARGFFRLRAELERNPKFPINPNDTGTEASSSELNTSGKGKLI